jgi:hypothetical protein
LVHHAGMLVHLSYVTSVELCQCLKKVSSHLWRGLRSKGREPSENIRHGRVKFHNWKMKRIYLS